MPPFSLNYTYTHFKLTLQNVLIGNRLNDHSFSQLIIGVQHEDDGYGRRERIEIINLYYFSKRL